VPNVSSGFRGFVSGDDDVLVGVISGFRLTNVLR
jgi:hypothetical protein